MQGFLLILRSCNNVYYWSMGQKFSWTTECVKKESILSKQCRVADKSYTLISWAKKSCSNNSLQKYKHRTKIRSRSNLRGLPREPNFFLVRFRALYKRL